MTDQQQRHVFISYVRENQDQVDRLCQDLERHGVNIWLDRNSIKPGARWKSAIQEAIRNGNFFIACFSEEYTSKTKSYMNEELILATEELRQYASDREWFIPVLLSECDVPARSIGAGETLLDINWVPLYENWDTGIQRILSVIEPIPVRVQKPITALRSEDIDVRYVAVRALNKIGDPSTVTALSEALKDNNINVRAYASAALGKIGSAAVSVLVEALREPDSDVRQRVAQALGQIGPEAKAAVPALIDALKDQEEWDYNTAAQALVDINTPEARKALEDYYRLFEALKDPDESIRNQAAQDLGYIGPEAKTAVQALIEALKDDDEMVRYYAAEALENIGTPDAQKAIEEYQKKSK